VSTGWQPGSSDFDLPADHVDGADEASRPSSRHSPCADVSVFPLATENMRRVQGRSDTSIMRSIRLSCGRIDADPSADRDSGGLSMAFAPTKRTKDVLLWMLSTKMMPPVGVLVPIYLIYRDFGLLDTRAGLVLIHLASVICRSSSGMLFTYFKEIPEGYPRAARMDGERPSDASSFTC